MSSVSIIIPTYNRAALVREAVTSCLKQSTSDVAIQIVVVDDCSADSTNETLEGFGEQIEVIRLVRNSGVCVARNHGFQRATGHYVKFLDSDDVLTHGTLAREVELADRTAADIVVTGWGVERIDAEHRAAVSRRKLYSAPRLDPVIDSILLGRAVPTSSALYRRALIQELAWDAGIGGSLDDWDFFCQAALRTSRIVSLDDTAYWMREHDGVRITSASTMLANAIGHHRILRKIEDWLKSNAELTPARQLRLAQYYFKELRVLCVYDRDAFDAALGHIYELDPNFRPRDEERQRWMRLLMAVFGVRRVLIAHSALKSIARKPPRRAAVTTAV